jgi:inhibitor of cysteine peptidase
MQKEIKKRAKIYGMVAVISAIVLGALIYNFGIIQPEFQLPLYSSPLRTFGSYEDLVKFLLTNSQTQGGFQFYGPWDVSVRGLPPSVVPSAASSAPSFANSGGSESTLKYSTTNIQVSGVDEADIVKTDGERIFLVSGKAIWISRVYPPKEAEVLSNITFDNDKYPAGIFVMQNKLAILGSEYIFPSPSPVPYPGAPSSFVSYYGDVRTFVNIYDVSDARNPVLLRNFTISGSYFNSRMIGDYVYLVTSKAAYVVNNDTVILPMIYSNEGTKEIGPSEIRYSNVSDNYFSFTTIAALNMQNNAEKPSYETVMMGGTSNMYVSLKNIYITFPESYEGTSVYRIHIENSNINIEANGIVPGSLLNQFSMDEYGDYFRIATTTWVLEKWTFGTQQNNVYVLDMNLSIVGKLENLASGESLHSARFMGDRGYLVTFKKTDPLFLIDLSQPTNPSVLGELKIPGYSDYLHPYDETHLIGVGKHTIEADEGDFAWYQGVKISLFDVSDVANPKQIANYTIGDRGTDSPILTDPKAFLFDKEKALLVIPVSVAEIDASQYPSGVPSWAYGNTVWQGAYVFNTSLDGFVLKGTVTHLESGENVYNTIYWVKRSLYIENVLYTVSDKKIKMNNLDNLAPINEIKLP